MGNKTFLYIALAFVGGLAAGATGGYLFTKKDCDIRTQQAINEMKVYYKKELENAKKEASEDESKEINEAGEEAEEQKEDEESSQSFMESSSIVNSFRDSSDVRTNYSFSRIKEAVKKHADSLEEQKKKAVKEQMNQFVMNYDQYMECDYDEETFSYISDEDVWKDWNGVDYDVDELPFSTDILIWTDDQCYIGDDENHSVYILERK